MTGKIIETPRLASRSHFGQAAPRGPQPDSALAEPMGAFPSGQAYTFRVWAPRARQVRLRLLDAQGTRQLAMERHDRGYFVLQTPAIPGDRYFYIVDENQPAPDPVSRLLPEGVHGPTQIVDPGKFIWSDSGWCGLPLKDYVIYELHVGAFTPAGTFAGVMEKLGYLKRLGVTVIEIMPVAAFPGVRNWGYDGASPYAVQAGYGGPEGLRRLVDAAHEAGLGVILDVVYNHLGNEGNYLPLFGPYLTSLRQTPWGNAINYDREGCEEVRRYFIGNALYWIREYRLDGLRLDAVQTIHDDSPQHILAEMADSVAGLARETGRQVCLIAETDENDEKIVRPAEQGGYGLQAAWSDDFHHAVHAFLTGERKGYYRDFGQPGQIARALQEGFVFQGEPFQYWGGRKRGTSSRSIPAPAHVICMQNHDQVGNRALGERLSTLIPQGARMAAAALLLLAPQTPLLFMGQEFDEPGPFQFFTDYGDPALRKAVTEGRRNEFKDFDFHGPAVPDPQDPRTFARSRLNWELASPENETLAWYRALLRLRRKSLMDSGAGRTSQAEMREGILALQVPAAQPKLQVVVRMEGKQPLPEPGPRWKEVLAAERDGYKVSVREFLSSAASPDAEGLQD